MNPKMITALKVGAPLLVIALAAVAAASLAAMRPEPERREVEVLAPLVRVETVRIEDTRFTVISQGTVAPRTESRVAPQVSGRVVWVSPDFIAGGFLEADEPLLRIDPIDYQQAVVRAEAEIAAARLRLAQEEAEARVAREEWEELGGGDAPELTLRIPQLENARASVAAAEAALERARRDLERTEIRAPYRGRVREKRTDVGQFVGVGADLGTIYAIDYAEIRLPLPDGDLAYLDLPLVYRQQTPSRGPEVKLTAEFAGRRHEWEGRIVRTEGEIDPTTRMVHAIARVADPYGRGGPSERPPLAVGMYVEAEILGRVAERAAVLPRAALRTEGDHVLVIDREDRLHIRPVEVLRTTRDRVVIGSGLEEGERVVVSALDAVVDGMQVRVVETGAAPGAAR